MPDSVRPGTIRALDPQPPRPRRAALRRPRTGTGRDSLPGRQHQRRVLQLALLQAARERRRARARWDRQRGRSNLEDVLGADFLAPIVAAKRISFHTVGDTGASSTAAISKEASVTDAMASDDRWRPPRVPAFCFHLGDVIYNFGEAEYYYDQFYEPFRGLRPADLRDPRKPRRRRDLHERRLAARRAVAAGLHRELLHSRRRASLRMRAAWRARR